MAREFIAVDEASAFVEANYQGDPLIKHLFGTLLDKFPRVEAEGKWEEWYPPKHMILTGEEMLYRCSVCTAKYPDVAGYNYCPHCGARMEVGYGPYAAG